MFLYLSLQKGDHRQPVRGQTELKTALNLTLILGIHLIRNQIFHFLLILVCDLRNPQNYSFT